MPITDFDSLPNDARVWVFAATSPLAEPHVHVLLSAVDQFLETWKAHGHPLRSARDFREQRFLAVGVDQSSEGASGCSIDGLFRELQRVEKDLPGNLFPGGLIFWRDESDGGRVVSGTRAEFGARAAEDTRVFDTTITSAEAWRTGFERPARDTWHLGLLRKGAQK